MHRSISAVILGASLVAACGGSGGGDVSIDDLGNYIIDTECGIEVECNQVADLATCKSGFQLNGFDGMTIIADAKTGIIKYDSTKATACFDMAKADGCNFSGLHSDPNSPCNGYLTGTVAAGGACFFSNECVTGSQCTPTMSSCNSSTACCAGTCGASTATTPVAVGGACGGTAGTDCVVTAYCKGSTTTTAGTCTALVATAGAACDDIFGCAGTMICDMPSSTAGTCYQPAAEGATCDPNFFVSDFACLDDRDYCDTASKKCIKRVAAGATCSDTILCQGLAQCVGTTCVANGGVGATCDSQNGPGCISGLSCTASKCTAQPAGTDCRP